MKGILKFKLPEESKEHLSATMGTSLACMLFEIQSNVRRKYLKYNDLTDEEYSIAEKIFDDINEIIDINLDELV